jgi:hypothetical protein
MRLLQVRRVSAVRVRAESVVMGRVRGEDWHRGALLALGTLLMVRE